LLKGRLLTVVAVKAGARDVVPACTSTCLLEGHSDSCSFPSPETLVKTAERQCWFCKGPG